MTIFQWRIWCYSFLACCVVLQMTGVSCRPATLSAGPADPPLFKVAEEFLSFTIDVAQILDSRLNFSEATFLANTRALMPAFLRIGGTKADSTYWQVSSDSVPPGFEHVISQSRIRDLCAFAAAVGTRLVIGLSNGPASQSSSSPQAWDPSVNAAALLAFLRDIQCPVHAFELGNEYNLFVFNWGIKSVKTPSSIAQDIFTLRGVVDQVYGNGSDILLAGIDDSYQFPLVGELAPLTKDVVSSIRDSGKPSPLSILTWHWYPLESNHCPAWWIDPHYCTLDRALSASAFNEPERFFADLQAYAASIRAELWCGETALSSCGGTQNVSDAFAGSFFWLNELGQFSRAKHAVILRQTLDGFGNRYSLLDASSSPLPDFWASWLWKQLVSSDVYDLEVSGIHRDIDPFRAYLMGSLNASFSRTFVLINGNLDAAVTVAFPPDFCSAHDAEEFVVQAANGLPSDGVIMVNGIPITSTIYLSEPVDKLVSKVPCTALAAYVLPPLTYAFIRI
eukprot:ANDGO_05826.mRNA.1 Heparanase-like protein 3